MKNFTTIIEKTYTTDGRQCIGECIAYGREEGYKFYVLTGKTCPLCYISVANTALNKESNYDKINLKVNGGLTFASEMYCIMYDIEQACGWCIGWDYDHPQNVGIHREGYGQKGHFFPTEPLVEDCKVACRRLKKLLAEPTYSDLSNDILKFVDKKEYKYLSDFDNFAKEVVSSNYCNNLKIKLLKLLKEEKISFVLKKQEKEINSLLNDILRISFE